MQRVRRRESHAKFAPQRGVNRAGGLRPRLLAARKREQWIERELGALKRHRHSISRERWNHRARVAEANAIARRHTPIEAHRGDRAERRGVELARGESRGERGEAGGLKITEQEIRALRAKRAATEEAADVDLAGFHACEADIGVFAEMQFKVA